MPIKLILSYLYLIVMFLAQLFITRAITSNFGIELYGVWAILMSIQTYLFAVDSGFSSSVTTYTNVFIERGDRASVRNLLSTNIVIVSTIFTCLLILVPIISQLIQRLLVSDVVRVFTDWNMSSFVVVINVFMLSIIGIFSNYLIATYRIGISKIFQMFMITKKNLINFNPTKIAEKIS